tara:strand:- start:635 stop:826 length:192 start_codon:yes stop_codon:yes gene_type:complete
MKIGDLIRVKYHENKDDAWYHGVLVESAEDVSPGFDMMWCAETESFHILQKNKDLIEVMCEAR